MQPAEFDRPTLPRAVDLVTAKLRRKNAYGSSVAVDLLAVTDLIDLGERIEKLAACHARVTELSASQAVRLARTGGTALFPIPAGWLITCGKKATCFRAGGSNRIRLTDTAFMRELTEAQSPCLVLEPTAGLQQLSYASTGSKNPWRRMWELLRLESREVWILVGYAVVLGALSLAVPVAVQVLVNTIALGSLMQPLVVTSILLLVVLILVGALRVAESYAVEVLARRIFVRVGEELTRKFLEVRYDTQDKVDLRDLANRFFEVVTLQKAASKVILDGLGLALQAFVGLVLLGFYHPTLLLFDAGLIIALVLVVALGNGAVPSAIAESNAKYAYAKWLQTIAGNVALFRRSDAASLALAHSDVAVRDYLVARRRHYRAIFRQLTASALVQAVAMVALLGIGGWLVMKQQLTLGQLVAAELVVGSIAAGFLKLSKYFESGYDLLAGLDKVGKVLDLETEDPSSTTMVEELSIVLEDLVVERLGTKCKISGSHRLAPGEHHVVVARDGADARTLLETLAGLRQPAGGDISLFDGAGQCLPLSGLCDHAFLVDALDLFSGSIRHHLRLSNPGASDEGLWQAIDDAGLRGCIEDLPKQLDTELVAGGAPLSRIDATNLGMARAFLARPALLLIDATIELSRCSSTSLAELLANIKRVLPTTIVVIASTHPNVRSLCKSELELGQGGTHG